VSKLRERNVEELLTNLYHCVQTHAIWLCLRLGTTLYGAQSGIDHCHHNYTEACQQLYKIIKIRPVPANR